MSTLSRGNRVAASISAEGVIPPMRWEFALCLSPPDGYARVKIAKMIQSYQTAFG